MTRFDKFCAILSIPIGVVFLVLGIVGLFRGANAHFTLPPVLGFLPFLLGWTMCVTTIRFWKRSNSFKPEDPTTMDPTIRPSLGRFGEFLDCHPEYKSSTVEVQMRLFKLWLNNQ